MLPTDVLLDWKGRVVVDLYGYRIGRIVDVQFKPETDVPEWGCITFGRLSLRRRFIPLADAELLAGQVRVPHTKAMVKGDPERTGVMEKSLVGKLAEFKESLPGRK